MATTNIPATNAEDRDTEYRRAPVDDGQNPDDTREGTNVHGDDIDDLDEQARAAVTERANTFFDGTSAGGRVRLNAELANVDAETRKSREAEYQAKADAERKRVVDDAMAVYEDAIQRRGRRQAAQDQLQGAVGLPADPRLRQREIERRTKEGDAAMQAQSGVGTVADNLEGRTVGTRSDVFFGDAGRAEFNPHVQQGHGHNIAAQAQAAARLQQIAPNAPMTPENVNDPHGANERMERDKAEQQSKEDPSAFRDDVTGDNKPKIDAGTNDGLTAEQRAQRDKLAGGSNPS